MESIYSDMSSVLDYIKVYESTARDLDACICDIAMEADTDTNMNDEDIKKSRSTKFTDIIKSLIDHIIAAIEKVMLNISNSLSKVYLTDKGFRKKMFDAVNEHKPRGTIRLIMYQYVDEVLTSQYGKLTSTISNLIDSIKVDDLEDLKSERNPLNLNKDEFEKFILGKLGAPNNVTDMPLYFVHIKDSFRGGKKETVIQDSQISYYRKLVDGYDQLKGELEKSKNLILNKARNMKSKLVTAMGSPTVPDDVKSKLIQHARNVTMAYNMYSSFVGIMYQLKVEQMLSSRIVLQRFYQF